MTGDKRRGRTQEQRWEDEKRFREKERERIADEPNFRLQEVNRIADAEWSRARARTAEAHQRAEDRRKVKQAQVDQVLADFKQAQHTTAAAKLEQRRTSLLEAFLATGGKQAEFDGVWPSLRLKIIAEETEGREHGAFLDHIKGFSID